MIDEIEPPPQVSYNTTEGVDGGTGVARGKVSGT